MERLKTIESQIWELRQQYEDCVGENLRQLYDRFISETFLDAKLLTTIEGAFLDWCYANGKLIRCQTSFGSDYYYLLLNSILVSVDLRGQAYHAGSLAWTVKNELCTGIADHCIPNYFWEGKPNYSIFTVKHFPELLERGLFNPSEYVAIDFEDVGVDNSYIYSVGDGSRSMLFTYGDYSFYTIPFVELKEKSKSEIVSILRSAVPL